MVISTLIVWPLFDKVLSNQGINIPILRYIIYFIGAIALFNLYTISSKIENGLTGVYRLIFKFLLYWIFVCFLVSIPDLFSSKSNYIHFKSFLSGEIIVFFSFFIVNICIPLDCFRLFLKVSYILAIIFLIIVIPAFSFFASSIENGAEFFVRNYFLGSTFLLLLFPFQRLKVNLVVTSGFILSILLMLLIARRNVVLYMTSIIFFLSIVIFFSRTSMLKYKSKLLVVTSIVFFICSFFLIVSSGDRFNFFFERASTGMQSRELVIAEFKKDFSLSSVDWLIGRGMFGTFQSEYLGDDFGERNLIENGYYYIILKQGLFFLIPFILLSLFAVYRGFFCSRNHLSKAAAILVVVNLIDMIGYGLPFLGLKYFNVLFALSFCFSSDIRRLDNYSIEKYVKI